MPTLTATGRSHGPGVVVVVVVVIVVGLFDYDNDSVPGFSVTTSVLIAPPADNGLAQWARRTYTSGAKSVTD
ncbi:hypothetical protein [uncultured Thiodictyon sp.]|uniref:hypothetical protein n=1 Tax=uncultured Thiodictyon sp. TaxID=1846217 RepID=UPI0025F0CCFA|nr:hypothetical protein [uncultured Thiodictyon sp.]